MISLSLLPTAHPRTSQGSPVRSFTSFYQRFNLAMGRSPPLRVQYQQLNALFGLAFAAPSRQKRLGLPLILTRRLIMQKARNRRTSLLLHLVDIWFQVLFHFAHSGSFHLSLAVLVHCRLPASILPYAVVCADSREVSRTSRYSGYL